MVNGSIQGNHKMDISIHRKPELLQVFGCIFVRTFTKTGARFFSRSAHVLCCLKLHPQCQ